MRTLSQMNTANHNRSAISNITRKVIRVFPFSDAKSQIPKVLSGIWCRTPNDIAVSGKVSGIELIPPLSFKFLF